MGKKEKEQASIKNDGQVFTPDYIVNNMLDFCGYTGSCIIGKHVMDNSCGHGAFLREVLRRYIAAAQDAGLNKKEIKTHLETYIHGIDADIAVCRDCLSHMSEIASESGIDNVRWAIHNDNSLMIQRYDGKMDFVVGNPPYVRVHNLKDNYNEVKRFAFANGGMTDLYLVFFEVGFRMLAGNGTLCYITPGSWLSSLAGANLRQYILAQKTLEAVVDLGHYQPFNAASAYTMISLFRKNRPTPLFDYYIYNGDTRANDFVGKLEYVDSCLDGCFYLADKPALETLKNIKCKSYKEYVEVKNGFATLADKVFIGEVPPSPFTIKVIKASTGKWYDCIYPYSKDGKPVPKEILFSISEIKDYFLSHKSEILKGKAEFEGWYYYGRTQALKDVQKTKYAINTIVRDADSLKFNLVPSGAGVYSGLYILTDIPGDVIEPILKSEDFIAYIKVLKNYKSGGYYTFSSKDLEQYLNYKLTELNMKKQNVKEGLSNENFLKAVSKSFCKFIISGSSKSPAKLKPVHGAIAKDIADRLGNGYEVKSQGYGPDKEVYVEGRYYKKKVDITICKNEKPVAGIAVKLVMGNYSQNSNNYFENMLGETANIRCNGIDYFQVFIILDKLPYYNEEKQIQHWETLTEHNYEKYVSLSQDDTQKYLHTPNKTLIFVAHPKDCGKVANKKEYSAFYRGANCELTISPNKYPPFEEIVILNDYKLFMDKVYHSVKAR